MDGSVILLFRVFSILLDGTVWTAMAHLKKISRSLGRQCAVLRIKILVAGLKIRFAPCGVRGRACLEPSQSLCGGHAVQRLIFGPQKSIAKDTGN